MKKIKKKILRTIEYVVKKEIEKEQNGNPPVCAGIMHQPRRPDNRK